MTFDKLLRMQHWNTSPRDEIVIPASSNPVWSAAKAIAICAFPQREKLLPGGKAQKYAEALVAYIFRATVWTGYNDRLPKQIMRAEKMWARLETGHRNLLRSMRIRDLIHSALLTKSQNDAAAEGRLSTFTLAYSEDLNRLTINIPIQQVDDATLLCGTIPNKQAASLRAAMRRHAVALKDFQGLSPRIDGLDEELLYQNTLNRFVRPILETAHVQQIVWEAINEHAAESLRRKLRIDQILMRKAVWAENLHIKAMANEALAIFNMRELGIPSCACTLVHIGNPLHDS